ncbi:4Fe-4S binding protein [Methanobrevibacter sp. OttesenSCG-928-I08]|nr:4Fe-4S binding protein [Methanobrevibacter sp. OttesenSCG-928-I08]
MEDIPIETPKPLRDVEVDYNIDQSKCDKCKDKPCLESCPIDAVFIDPNDGHTKIKNTCFGCVLCRNACPYDAIEMTTTFSPPIQENVPNINTKLCKACGACVMACKTGAIHLKSTSDGAAYSEIDEDKCVRCGYCFRVCPTDAIKYGPILPKSIKGGKAIAINHDDCIGCMTCSRVCPAKGAIEVSKISKLPYINPAYCARCEECMHSCPSTAIKYSSRKKAYANYSKIKSYEMVAEIAATDTKHLASDISKLDEVYISLSSYLSSKFDEDYSRNDKELNVTDKLKIDLELLINEDMEVEALEDLFDSYLIKSEIKAYNNLCIGCGECLEVCPVDALDLELPSNITIKDNCIHCGKCVSVCPVDALEVYDEFFKTRENEIYYCRSFVHNIRDANFNISNYKCQACGICTNFCPSDAIKIEDDKLVFNEDKCIYCRNCELICPVKAININVNKF